MFWDLLPLSTHTLLFLITFLPATQDSKIKFTTKFHKNTKWNKTEEHRTEISDFTGWRKFKGLADVGSRKHLKRGIHSEGRRESLAKGLFCMQNVSSSFCSISYNSKYDLSKHLIGTSSIPGICGIINTNCGTAFLI